MSWWTSGWFLGGSRSHFPRNPIWCCPRHTEWGPELSRGPLKSSHESYVPRLPMKYSKLIVAFLGTTSQKPLFLCATRMGWYHGSSVTSQPVRFPKIRTHNPNNDGRTPSNQRRILISECEWKTTEVVFPYAPCIVYLPTFGYIWAICGVNVGKYSIHGAYGYIVYDYIAICMHMRNSRHWCPLLCVDVDGNYRRRISVKRVGQLLSWVDSPVWPRCLMVPSGYLT